MLWSCPRRVCKAVERRSHHGLLETHQAIRESVPRPWSGIVPESASSVLTHSVRSEGLHHRTLFRCRSPHQESTDENSAIAHRLFGKGRCTGGALRPVPVSPCLRSIPGFFRFPDFRGSLWSLAQIVMAKPQCVHGRYSRRTHGGRASFDCIEAKRFAS